MGWSFLQRLTSYVIYEFDFYYFFLSSITDKICFIADIANAKESLNRFIPCESLYVHLLTRKQLNSISFMVNCTPFQTSCSTVVKVFTIFNVFLALRILSFCDCKCQIRFIHQLLWCIQLVAMLMSHHNSRGR